MRPSLQPDRESAAHLFGVRRRRLRRVQLAPHEGDLVCHSLLGCSRLPPGSLQLGALPLVLCSAARGRRGHRSCLRLGRAGRGGCLRGGCGLGGGRRRGGRRRLLRWHQRLLLSHKVALCSIQGRQQQRLSGTQSNSAQSKPHWLCPPQTASALESIVQPPPQLPHSPPPPHTHTHTSPAPAPRQITWAVHVHRIVVPPVVAAKGDHAARHGHRQQRQPLAGNCRIHGGVAHQRPLRHEGPGRPG